MAKRRATVLRRAVEGAITSFLSAHPGVVRDNWLSPVLVDNRGRMQPRIVASLTKRIVGNLENEFPELGREKV